MMCWLNTMVFNKDMMIVVSFTKHWLSNRYAEATKLLSTGDKYQTEQLFVSASESVWVFISGVRSTQWLTPHTNTSFTLSHVH